MNKRLLLFATVFCFILTCCGTKKADEYVEHNKILSLVNDFDINNTNGFDYILNQYYQDTIVNSHQVKLRIDSDNRNSATREETTKSLTSEIGKEQFDVNSEVYYYSEGQIGVYQDNDIYWQDYNFEQFANVKLRNFDFCIESFSSFNIIKTNEEQILNFSIADSNVNSFLNINEEIKNLVFEIKTDIEISKLLSFKMDYNQAKTKTTISFTPFYGTVDIDLNSINCGPTL